MRRKRKEKESRGRQVKNNGLKERRHKFNDMLQAYINARGVKERSVEKKRSVYHMKCCSCLNL